jgi:hypothetical protein
MTKVQNTSDRNVTVMDSPTVSPTTFGWISDWMTTLITE